LESDNHFNFLFIFVLMVVALIIGEVNNRAITERVQNGSSQMQTAKTNR
jgi:Na+-transporting methylmalonyl-CoA/oxaloacetate decarboxylase gamma subunit